MRYFCLLLFVSSLAVATPLFRGINLAGAEFTPQTLPGVSQKDFKWPTDWEVDTFLKEGLNTFRVPFTWERLQPLLNGAFDRDYAASLDQIVKIITKRHAYIILDPHNYARYRGFLIGSPETPIAAFEDLWKRLALKYRSNPNVVFGLMNEPHSMKSEVWAEAAQAGLNAIRNTRATNFVLVPGNAWSGAHSWLQSWYGTPNAEAMKNIRDPLGRFYYEVHQYLDSNSSGGGTVCQSATIGSERLKDFTQWAEKQGAKAVLGEFGVPNNRVCLDALKDLLAYMKANDKVRAGFTYWAAGSWWGDYPMSIEPPVGEERRAILRPYWAP